MSKSLSNRNTTGQKGGCCFCCYSKNLSNKSCQCDNNDIQINSIQPTSVSISSNNNKLPDVVTLNKTNKNGP